MPMLLGTKGNDILQWRASAELVTTLKESLARNWARSSAREAESFLGQFIDSLQEELSYEAQFAGELASLEEAIDTAGSPGELQPMQSRYKEVVSAHFRRRQSVLALCGACNRLHDRVLAKAATLAKERMPKSGLGVAPPHALLVWGNRGRGEQTLFGENRYLLLHEDATPGLADFRAQLADVLLEAGLLPNEQMLWQGSASEWRAVLEGSFPDLERGSQENLLAPLPPFAAPLKQGPLEMPEWGWHLEAMTDLRFLQGEKQLALQALDDAAWAVLEERNRGPFLLLARRTIGLPLAVGHFGRFRLQRGGEHQGELNLEELALSPLVMAIRVLAVHMGIPKGGTVERINAVLEKGALNVDLAGRLLGAFQCFMQLKIQSEIRSEESGSFCNPEEFDEGMDARFRSSVEAVADLQRIAYQNMVGQV